mmetsp:Transcript_1933/g.2965  ORF Transcript_1933/g.2965 Transcript_1933/m.2965 type:complete len:256 (-) Transcript_1933:366-1133(-)|eukprot:CAMPEP_0194218994 /NCGR_PEP_ID=MMETSP0156-20130528/24998_1 /TAXON_ID=33649 /ORGANISM="Thalassionema nitzschioides, Strain L26-B" /LENGTH=255 /DNA_ID=CAMNT_0038948527 /DNA_START=106 /DNA_END=873 /DNA_ORIENTATION=+
MKSFFAQQILLLLTLAAAEAFALPVSKGRAEINSRQRVERKWDPLVFTTSKSTKLHQEASSSNDSVSYENSNRKNLPLIIYRLNSSTKWLVTLANTLGIWCRLPHFEGPYIVVGAILTVYFTNYLKYVLNHDRPEGAPFADPGMPSSHSLVSFFMAAAWGSMVISRGSLGIPLVWMGATSVALLRVICGYHSWDQIGAGAVLGSVMGLSWAKLGTIIHKVNPKIAIKASWGLYIVGSLLFIFKNMRAWVQEDKHI